MIDVCDHCQRDIETDNDPEFYFIVTCPVDDEIGYTMTHKFCERCRLKLVLPKTEQGNN